MKGLIALSAKDLRGIIGRANIDIIFGKVPADPDRNASVVHGSKPSHSSNIDHRSGDNLQTENLQVTVYTSMTSTETISVEQFLRSVNVSTYVLKAEALTLSSYLQPSCSDETLKDGEKCEER
jgi:hypothetical protein